jgi:hypothetical protein
MTAKNGRSATVSKAAPRPRTALSRHMAPLLVFVLGALLLAPSAALAEFTRPLLRQITGTPSGAFQFGEGSAGGVTVDSSDDLWVGEGRYPDVKLDEFAPAYAATGNEFQKTLELGVEGYTAPASLAIENATDDLLVAGQEVWYPSRETYFGSDAFLERFNGTGSLVKRRGLYRSPSYVAIDNSNEPLRDPSACSVSGCTVYVSHGNDPSGEFGDGAPAGIQKLDANGEPAQFVEPGGQPTDLPYVVGGQIIGTPTEAFKTQPGSLVVDAAGDIYAIDPAYQEQSRPVVLEYRPSGEFVRAITGFETPGMNEEQTENGFGGDLRGLAVDPVSGHLLVSVEGRGRVVVDEFDAESGRFTNQIPTAMMIAGSSEVPVQMSTDSHGDIYLVDVASQSVDVYGPGRVLPGLRLGEAGDVGSTGVVLKGSVDPEGLGLNDCRFQYVTEEAFERNVEEHAGNEAEGFSDLSSGGETQCEPAAASIPQDQAFHAVSATLSSLVSGARYRYRLVATTSGELGGVAVSGSLGFTVAHAPRIDGITAENVSSTFADLSGRIAPLGADTSYDFQYVDEADFNTTGYAAAITTPVADIGHGGQNGAEESSVLQHIGPLQPGVVYRFRLRARNSAGEAVSADGTFTTLPAVASGLPDGRAYELLTPPNKGSAADMFATTPEENGEVGDEEAGVASVSGNRFLLETRAAFGPSPASHHGAYVFTRTASGWSYTSLTPPADGVQDFGGVLFDPVAFSWVAVNDLVGSEGDRPGKQLLNLVGAPGGPYTVAHEAPAAEEREQVSIDGVSRDGTHAVLSSEEHDVLPGAAGQDPGSTALYEWSAGVDSLTLVNANSQGALLNPCGAVLGQDYRLNGGTHNAISSDGGSIAFTAPDPYVHFNPVDSATTRGCWNQATNENAPQVYVRGAGRTVQISAPEPGVQENGGPPVQDPAGYVGASEDGSKVFFLTESELTSNDTGIHDLELYEYDSHTEKLTRISAGESGNADADVYTVPAIADDGSAVYFTAAGALAHGATSYLPQAATSSGPVNLYRYDTLTGSTTYVATVYREEAPNGNTYAWFHGIPGVAAEPSPEPQTNWDATPDGRFLLFDTSYELKAGYSTTGACRTFPDTGGGSNGHCEELYRYDSTEPVSEGVAGVRDNPVCVSCAPSDVGPRSNAQIARSTIGSPGEGLVRAMSDDGAYVFFDTADSLVPQDVNGSLDVYEWHEGRLSLISSGSDAAPSFFLGASADGSDVFFGTHARLVPADTDTAGDVYDARICTAADPCIAPAASGSALCEGDACQSAPEAQLESTPGSLTFAGAGNAPSSGPSKAVKRTSIKKPSGRKSKKAKHKRKHKAKARRRIKGNGLRTARTSGGRSGR